MKKKYVTAFPGRRDSYQLPLALSAHDRLASFVTCFYAQKGLSSRLAKPFGRLAEKLNQRRAPGLDQAKVECMEAVDLATRLGSKIIQPSKISVWEDDAFARRALALAKTNRAGLLLYEFQADWAFRQPLPHDGARILFQFHPHPDLEHPILFSDGRRYPQFMAGIHRSTRANLSSRYRDHTRNAWRQADHVMVASQFTGYSLQVAGCPAGKISVVPYGCAFSELPARPPARPATDKPYFLFVGSGSHRKGLHHLLEAWSQSSLTESHELIVIARTIEPAMRPLLAGTKSVRHLPGVATHDLQTWFASAKAFILPSLSEGFGHVYLEALACGCPVIGTKNSMLPDFSEAQAHVRYVEPGDPASIAGELEKVGGMPSSDPFFGTDSIRLGVRAYTWQRFRDGVEAVLERFD
ncbi:MAG TPA: glycosyltransferase [Opitutaceae bacterium]|nr:glycosyltransferase [Opitutaceae bacterium]